jgi:hypothetical protein
MSRVEDGEPVDHLGVVHRGRPGDRPAPIVADQRRRFGTELSDQAADIGGEQVDAVGLEALRLRRQVVAACVWRDHSEARRRERLDLQAPTEPELRETVQQDDQRPVARLDVMQALIADLGVSLAKLDPVMRHQLGERAGEQAWCLRAHAISFLETMFMLGVRAIGRPRVDAGRHTGGGSRRTRHARPPAQSAVPGLRDPEVSGAT